MRWAGRGGGGKLKIKSIQRGVANFSCLTKSVAIKMAPADPSRVSLCFFHLGNKICEIPYSDLGFFFQEQFNKAGQIIGVTLTPTNNMVEWNDSETVYWEITEYTKGISIQRGSAFIPNSSALTVNMGIFDPVKTTVRIHCTKTAVSLLNYVSKGGVTGLGISMKNPPEISTFSALAQNGTMMFWEAMTYE